jgi:hypothetical protein
MTISNELLDELLQGCKRLDDLLGEAELMKELKIWLMNRILGAELISHLGHCRKPHKLVIIAMARRLVTIANSIIKTGSPWQLQPGE